MDSLICIIYGPTKTGKTTDLLYSFPRAGWLCLPGGTYPSLWIGYRPTIISDKIWGLDELNAALEKLVLEKVEQTEIVIDDFSTICQNAFLAIVKKYSTPDQILANYNRLREKLVAVCLNARKLNKRVFINAHEEVEKDNKSKRHIRGGPKLGGSMQEDFCSICDVVLKVVPFRDRVGWPFVYQCDNNDRLWISSDRTNSAYNQCPMNLAEILRSSGLEIAHLPTAEQFKNFQRDGVVPTDAEYLSAIETCTQKIMPQTKNGASALKAFCSKIFDHYHVTQKWSTNIVNWLLRTSVDRATINIYKQSRVSLFTIPSATPK